MNKKKEHVIFIHLTDDAEQSFWDQAVLLRGGKCSWEERGIREESGEEVDWTTEGEEEAIGIRGSVGEDVDTDGVVIAGEEEEGVEEILVVLECRKIGEGKG